MVTNTKSVFHKIVKNFVFISPVFLLVILNFVIFLALTAKSIVSEDSMVKAEFDIYLERYSKSYPPDEYEHRLSTYQKNLAYIHYTNTLQSSIYLRVNQFTDMSSEEFHMHFSQMPLFETTEQTELSNLEYPTSVDWVEAGAVTPVKNENQCGSCYAFSTVGAVEGAWFIAGNPLTALSAQQILDCSANYGCNGGWPSVSYQYIIQNGLALDSDYPYTGTDGLCNKNAASRLAARIKSYVNVPANNYQALLQSVSKQPVQIVLDPYSADFQSYGGGIYNNPNCGTSLEHTALIVGYNTINTPYWVIKNSWGTTWGEAGYMQLAIKDGAGVCGVNMMASYPVI